MNTICPETGCPEPERLRALLDHETEPPGAEPPGANLADHLASCEACQAALGAVRRDADHAAQVLTALAVPAPSTEETEAALARVRRRLAPDAARPTSPVAAQPVGASMPPLSAVAAERTNGVLAATIAPEVDPALTPPTTQPASSESPASASRRRPVPLTVVWQRWRLALAGLAAALALAFALATPEGQAIAAGFLAQFRSQRLAIVTFDPNQSRQTGLFRLEQLGSVRNNQPPRPTDLASVQEAASRLGAPVLQPDPATLPAWISRTPKVRFSPASETRLTFDRAKARAYFDSINRKDLSLPDRLHDATLVVALPPIVMLEYTASDNKPALMIGQAREVQVGVEGGATLEEVRTFLLNMPDLPPDLVRQLRSIQDWTSTLPIPVPVDKMTWQETTIVGAPAYILNDNTGLGSGVIWQRDGRIFGVAGPMKATDLRRVAESLK
jgi:hypothetical protein